MALAAMQRRLTDLYGLEIGYNVKDFLITDRLLADALGGGERVVDEELLIVEHDGEAEVSLYLEHELVGRLERNDPNTALTHDNLADFWVAFEGVSHFTYFVFKAGSDQRVTLLEMELQAEVDKFIATVLLLRDQGEKLPQGLLHWLFELPKFDDRLTPDEHERYERANHYAAKYCSRLWPRLARDSAVDDLRRELRHFYRLPSERKIDHIESC